MNSRYEAVAGLPLTIESYRLERRSRDSGSWTRRTTTVVLEGGGEIGAGEDVTWDPEPHDEWPDELALTGSWTVDELSRRLDSIELFPAGSPDRSGTRDFRRWAVESAALDLALRQAGVSLGVAWETAYRPVRFVVSSASDLHAWLDVDPSLEFKVDFQPDWDREAIDALAGTGRVRIVDLKGHYRGTRVETPGDPALYAAIAEALPEAILEDPEWTRETAGALADHVERIAWDAPIHAADDLDRMPVAARWLNVKPSRFGSVRELCACLDLARERGISLYGGGQSELGSGRAQIQALASLVYPDAPNDVAPRTYNRGTARAGLPSSPLPVPASPVGFGTAE